MADKDLEASGNKGLTHQTTTYSGNSGSIYESSKSELTGFAKFKDSFRQEKPTLDQDYMATLTEEQKVNYVLANQPFKQRLKKRHLQMISIGGTLGTGIFIGLGYTLSSGPGATLLGYVIVGFVIFCMMQAAAELLCAYPVSGSFASHVLRFVDPAIGFTASINYALGWLIGFPSELIGCSMVMSYWTTDVNPAVWVLVFYLVVLSLNLIGVKAYGESEFYLSIFKVLAAIVFIIIGIVLVCGGGPDSSGYIGARYWHDPGAFRSPVFKSICGSFLAAAFSFGGSELVILTAAEASGPTAISRATKQVFWRIALFYITTIVVISCLVPYNDKRLLGASSSEDISASPFVIALSNTGRFGFHVSHFMNAVILIAVVSVANSGVYASSRVIQSLGAVGKLPKFCAYIDKLGRPLGGMAVAFTFGLLGFIVALSNQSTVFTWLFSFCSLSSFFTWGCICFAHVRFRAAMKSQNRKPHDELTFTAMFGAWGSLLGAIVCALLIIAEIYISISPVEHGEHVVRSPRQKASDFFEKCLSIPLMITYWTFYRWRSKLLTSRPLKRALEVDLDTGRRFTDFELVRRQVAEEKEAIRKKGWWYSIYRFWC